MTLSDLGKWLEKLAPHAPTEQYQHNRTGEDNADAHMKRQIMGREVVVASLACGGEWARIAYVMRLRPLPAVIFCLVILCGCASSTGEISDVHGARDFGSHFLERAIAHGARPQTTTDLPKVRIPWEEKSDKNGIQFKTERRHYREIARFIEKAFGKPRMPEARVEGGVMAVYAARDIGVAIQVGTEGDDAFVVLIRAMSWDQLRNIGESQLN